MLNFKASDKFTVGTELELQIVDQNSYDLAPLADEVLQQLKFDEFTNSVKPEITQSMLEINSNVHESPQALLDELRKIRSFLISRIEGLNIHLSGGGTHPFQMWNDRKIYPTARFKKAADKYGYLAKMFTVFGLHIHIGCSSGDDAIYLMHTLARYIPQFIALSASSPFCQGIDTEFASSRSNVVNAFPLIGLPPVTQSWENFVGYFEKIQALKIAERIDNFYWDIRPRPEYGSVEIRVCDAPLTIEKTAMLAAYAQTLAHYILEERPFKPIGDECHLYRYNRFQACRYGFNGTFINPQTHHTKTIGEDILETCNLLYKHIDKLGNQKFFWHIIEDVTQGQSDAEWIRNLFNTGKTLSEIINFQSLLWEGKMSQFASRQAASMI